MSLLINCTVFPLQSFIIILSSPIIYHPPLEIAMDNQRKADAVVQVQIPEQPGSSITIKLSDNWGSALFEPQGEPSNPHQSTPGRFPDPGPEKKLTLFALRLAVLEKAASGLGTLGFIWATVVLLGGFAIMLQTKDFWFITVILLIEGTRIFSRSHELEWQHQATWSLAEAGMYSFHLLQSTSRRFLRAFRLASSNQPPAHRVAPVRTRTWRPDAVPILPYGNWIFLSRNISRLLYWLQLLSASACVSLSLTRILAQDYGAVDESGKTNRKSALNIFYSLALAEALLFLAERAFWEWKVSYRRLLEEVNRECDLGHSGMVSIRRFFYDAYSRCVNGSIFDGLKMDLVSFAEELLTSSSRDEQLIGIRILLKSATSYHFADETLRKLGSSTLIVERLIEMLNWKNPAEEEIRRSAAEIVSKLAGKKQNALRLGGIPGAMESISSLLCLHPNQSSHEITSFNLLGLKILKKLARNHNNCGKIGSARGLLTRIIDFTSGAADKLSDPATEIRIKSVERSLELLKMLAGTSCHSLRRDIAEIVFAISNIRDILQHSENQVIIQKPAIEILTSLAMGEEARERIGGTGGVITELLRILFRPAIGADPARAEAGEALAMLALQSEMNCRRILKPEGAVDRLVEGVGNPAIRVNCCRILRNLCCYSRDHADLRRLGGVTVAFPAVLKSIMAEEINAKLLEVSIGLGARMLRLMSGGDACEAMEGLRVAERLAGILRRYRRPSMKVPRMRRFVMEMAIEMMRSDGRYAAMFAEAGMGEELERVEETTEELECFHVFLGSAGVSRHRTGICELVETALGLMSRGCEEAGACGEK